MAVIHAEERESTVLALLKAIGAYWALVIPLVLLVRFLYYRYVSPLRKYPGPLLASGSRAWKVCSTWADHTEMDHIRIHEKYGPIVRIAPGEVSLASPTAAREVLAAGKGFHKTDFYWVIPPPENPDIFTEIREDVHAIKKRHASHPGHAATPYEQARQDVQGSRSVLHLGNYLHYFAFDVLGEVAFSRKFGFLEAGFDVEGAIKTIDDVQWCDGIVGQIPEWDYVFRRNSLWKFIPWLRAGNFLITRMALEEMDERKRFGKPQERKDLLSQLLDAHAKAPDAFKEGDIFAVAHGAIMAGSDSTASTMQSFSYHVLRDPAIYANLKQELDEATASGKLSEMPQWSEAQSLPYFQACLEEAMRLRPAVGLNICRLVPPGGAEIGGQFFPGGTRIVLNGWVLHRDKEIFLATIQKLSDLNAGSKAMRK